MRALRYSLLAISICVLGLLGWRSLQNRPVSTATVPQLRPVPRIPEPAPAPTATPLPAPPATADQRIAEIPEFAGFYGKLRIAFPGDFATFRATLGAATPMPNADAAIWDAMRDLQQARGVLAAGADGATLDRYFDARSAMVAGLAPLSARLCADYLYGQTGTTISDFTAAHRGLVATLADRQLAAIVDGLAQHRDHAAPSDADIDALAAALKTRGLSPGEVSLLIDGQAPDPPLPDVRLCQIGQAYLDTLHDLPPDPRHRIYSLAAELLARS